MLDEHYFDLLSSVAELVTELGEHPDAAVAEKVESLLQQIDLVHREGLLRLIEALRARGAGETIEAAIEEDSVVRVLLGLYGLAELPLPAETDSAPESGDADRPGFFPIEQLRVRRPATP